MKVSVCAKVVYQYEIEIPDEEDIEIWADTLDPVYSRIVTAMVNTGLNYGGSIVSIVGTETNEIYYVGD